MNAAILAAIIALNPGFNQGIPADGQVAAVQVVTGAADGDVIKLILK